MKRNDVIMGALCAALCGCGDSSTGTSAMPDDGSSFGQLQASVFAKSCAVSGCHVAASAAEPGNLTLTGDAAYGNLINGMPTKLGARQDGLRRVVPFKPDSSLLLQKIVLAAGTHIADYGNTMPVGAPPLPQGQVDFVRKWIEAGAPKAGDVADASLLRSTTPQAAARFVPLAPPAVGQGIQLKVDSFSVQPNFERELFVYRPLSNASEIYVNRIQTSMRPLSHHFALYSVDATMAPGWPCTPAANTVRDIRNPDGSMNLLNMIPM